MKERAAPGVFYISKFSRIMEGAIGYPVKRPWWMGYAVTAIVESLLVAGLRVLQPVFPLAEFTVPYILVVMISTYLFGEGPGAFAFLAGLVVLLYFFITPYHILWPLANSPEGWARLTSFVIGSIVVWFAALMIRKSRQRLQQLADELRESGQQVSNILESIDDAFFALDRDLEFTYINAAAERLLQKSWGELVGSNIWDQFPEAVGTIFQTGYEKALSQQVTVQFEGFYPPYGRWYDVRAYPSRDGLSVYFTDITERKRVEEELQTARATAENLREQAEQQAAELRSIMSSMADGVCVTDDQGNILWMNDSGNEIIGLPLDYPFENLLKLNPIFTLDGEPIAQDQTVSSRALHGETVKDFREKLITPWGKEAVISVSASPVIDADGNITGATFVFRDQSERVGTEHYKEKQLHRERHIAEILQQALIPQQVFRIPCCEVATGYEPALEEAGVGGDFYDIFEMGSEKVGVLIGDVAGKGLSAAIQVAAARHTIRSYAYLDPRPSRVMTLANEALIHTSTDEVPMVTAIFAVVDTHLGTITYANGGHGPFFLQRADGSTEEIEIAGRVLGVMGGYEYRENSSRLYPGDTVVLVTDGITESRTGVDQFGNKGVTENLSQLRDYQAHQIATALLESAKKHGGGSLRDDAAVIVLRYSP